MALDPQNVPEYVGRVTAPDANYPLGSSQNESAPGNDDGTPYIKKRADDLWGLLQGLLTSASISPNNSPDTVLISQYLKAINEQASGRAQGYVDGGAANAYVLGVKPNQQTPEKLFDGQELWFNPDNDQTTAACTIDAYGQGPLAVKKPGGVADPEVGSILQGVPVKVTYRAAPGSHFELDQPFTFTNTIVGGNYIVFPNGFKVQWGNATATAGGALIALPVAFTSSYQVVGSWNTVPQSNIPPEPVSYHVNSLADFRVTVDGVVGGVKTSNWIAAGF